MTAAEFRDWRRRMELTQAEAAQALGINIPTIIAYENGQHPRTGEKMRVPRLVELACQAVEFPHDRHPLNHCTFW